MAFSFSKIPLLTYLTFVTLLATHCGLTFCLFMGTLYNTMGLHSSCRLILSRSQI